MIQSKRLTFLLSAALLAFSSYSLAGDQGSNNPEPPIETDPELSSADGPITSRDDWESPVARALKALFGFDTESQQ